MFIRPLITLLLPTLLLAAPLAPRADDCVPTIYTINEYTFTTGANSTNPAVHFYFIPTYTNPSIITDPSLITTGGSSCGANAATLDTFPTESECSTGRANLIWDLRNRVDRAEIQIIHGWGLLRGERGDRRGGLEKRGVGKRC
ncbi:hypothetical protein CC80DRAFT_488832 [Byssothecium circinans]|uniref:Uncharacterized protein n=1 Tax=Byssothecium circinans TaxID=147558 RepID=A0A6A5U850_9PLEO|nr:hypothetical protein CC80DRAFT_488832 [Byssothecium circinans]